MTHPQPGFCECAAERVNVRVHCLIKVAAHHHRKVDTVRRRNPDRRSPTVGSREQNDFAAVRRHDQVGIGAPSLQYDERGGVEELELRLERRVVQRRRHDFHFVAHPRSSGER